MRKYIIALLFFVIVFNGFNNIKELTDLAIVKAMGIDLTEDGKYHISAIIIDTSDTKNTNSGIIYESIGDSVHDAARNIVGISPKKLYIAHMETLVISEEVAKSKTENVLDFFMRDNEGSNAFYLFIAKGAKSSEIVNVINNEKIDMVSFLESTEKYRGIANLKNLNEIMKNFLKNGIEVCVNSISIKEDKILIDDMAYFKDWQMINYLTSEESVLYNILINEVNNIIISIDKEDNLIVAEIIDSKSKIKIEEDNTIKVEINLRGNLTETGKDVEILNNEDLRNIEAQFEKKLNEEIQAFCEKIKNKYNIDIIGFGNLLYRKNNELYLQDDYLKKINIKVDTHVNINNQGGFNKLW